MKAISLSILALLVAACTPSEDLPHERVAFTIHASHGKVDITCSGDKRLSGLIGLVEYRKDQKKLFATIYDGNEKVVATMPIEKNETCSLTPSTSAIVSGIDALKYYKAAHTWVSKTKQNIPVCLNMQQKRTCLEATAILQMTPKSERDLGTQAAYVLMDNQMKVIEAFVVPVTEAQDFSAYTDIPVPQG